MANERHVAKEVRDEYLDTMNKIYYSYFKGYLSRLMKLQVFESFISVSMTRKCHNHTLQTNPQYHKEEAKNDNSLDLMQIFIKCCRPLVKSAYLKINFFLFLNQNICCGYSKELSQ